VDIVHELADQAISAQIGVHDALLRFSKTKEKIRTDEVIYLVLTLTVCSLFRWGQFKDAEALADVLTDRVFRLNLGSNAIPALSQAVKTYRIRFDQYRAALPALTVDELGFGLLLSRNITGQDNAVIGICLCGYAVSILADFEKTHRGCAGYGHPCNLGAVFSRDQSAPRRLPN
jgi:hypothetical protein